MLVVYNDSVFEDLLYQACMGEDRSAVKKLLKYWRHITFPNWKTLPMLNNDYYGETAFESTFEFHRRMLHNFIFYGGYEKYIKHLVQLYSHLNRLLFGMCKTLRSRVDGEQDMIIWRMVVPKNAVDIEPEEVQQQLPLERKIKYWIRWCILVRPRSGMYPAIAVNVPNKYRPLTSVSMSEHFDENKLLMIFCAESRGKYSKVGKTPQQLEDHWIEKEHAREKLNLCIFVMTMMIFYEVSMYIEPIELPDCLVDEEILIDIAFAKLFYVEALPLLQNSRKIIGRKVTAQTLFYARFSHNMIVLHNLFKANSCCVSTNWTDTIVETPRWVTEAVSQGIKILISIHTKPIFCGKLNMKIHRLSGGD